MEATESYFTEAELLNIFCDLYWGVKGNISEVKKQLGKFQEKNQWILNFFENFEEITGNAKSVILNKERKDIANLFFVGNENNFVLSTNFFALSYPPLTPKETKPPYPYFRYFLEFL